MDLICPKCQGRLRQYERSGVTVDQCTECRGIFLDRGELERLIDADAHWQAQASSRPEQPRYESPHAYDSHGKPYKKRKSFFEELFD